MTGNQRMLAAIMGELADYIPAFPMTGCCNAQLVGATIKEFLTNPKVFVKAQVASYEYYQPDSVPMTSDVLMEAEALGNELIFPRDSICISRKLVLFEKNNLVKLKVPNPYQDGRMPNYLEACKEAKKWIQDCPVNGVVCGPWQIAMNVRGAEELLRDSWKDKNYVHELMGFTSEVTRSFGEALLEQGVGFSVTEAAASCSLISPKIYRELIFPYEKQIFDHFKERNMTPGLHICGYVDPILEDMVATGATRISIDAPTDLGKLITLTVGKAAVVGNLDTSLFFQGSKEEMELAVKTCLQIAGKKGGYILSTGCDLPAITSPERVKWFMEAARRFGSNENEYNSNGKEGFLC